MWQPMRKSTKLFLVFGVGGSSYLFLIHYWFFTTAMNPLAFLVCIIPLIICLPGLLFDDDDF